MKFSRFIVKSRVIILIVAIALLVPAAIGMITQRINYDMLTYLPSDIDTMIGQDILMDEFGKGAFSFIVVEGMSDQQVSDLRDRLEAVEHVRRIKGFTEIIAKTYMKLFPEKGLTPAKINMIVQASALHDIGKIAISDAILLKPGRLTEDERNVMKSHTTKGCEILNFLKDVQDLEQHNIAYEICRHHHERHDGGGYPDGLRENQIPLSAQFVSIADVYDALVSERPYKKPYDKDTAYHMIMTGECGAFNPELLQCLETAREEMEDFSDSL